MSTKQDVKALLSDELKDDLTKADLSGLINLLAELLVEERLKEFVESEELTTAQTIQNEKN